MTQSNEDADYPQNSTPSEPLRCSNCGNLLGFYSGRSEADLLIRCAKCNNDYDITLREGTSSYKRRSKRNTSFPKGQ